MLAAKISSLRYDSLRCNDNQVLIVEVLVFGDRSTRSDVNILLKCSYVRRLFQHAMEDSRPKSLLFHVLSFCICLLDPKRLVLSSYQTFRSQLNHGSFITPSYDTVVGMLERLGILPLLLVDLAILLY